MFDVVVIGGGYAGLTAATYLVRSRRHVCVIDNRRPRNRFAAASHGFLGHDGASPVEILERARDQLHNYPLICTIEGEAVRAEPAGSGFTVHLADGEQVSGRRIILAFGLTDNLPVIDGLSERWGKSVFHCPYCHGLEYSDRRLGVLYRLPMSVHQAMLVAEWGPSTLFLNGATLDAESADALAARGIAIDRGAVAGLSGDGESLAAVLLEDGRSCPVEALYVAPRSTLSSPIAAQLGCAIEHSDLGEMIVTDDNRQTTAPGVYAAGDIARAPHTIAWAVADGVTAATAAHRSLIFETVPT